MKNLSWVLFFNLVQIPDLGARNTYKKAKTHKWLMSPWHQSVLEHVSDVALIYKNKRGNAMVFVGKRVNFLMAASLQVLGTSSATYRTMWATPSLLDGTFICLLNFEHMSSLIGVAFWSTHLNDLLTWGLQADVNIKNENLGIQPRLWSWNTSFPRQSWGFKQTFSIKINGRYMP